MYVYTLSNRFMIQNLRIYEAASQLNSCSQLGKQILPDLRQRLRVPLYEEAFQESCIVIWIQPTQDPCHLFSSAKPH